MEKKVTNIKERVLQLIKFKQVVYEKFFPTIGVTYANFKGDAKKKALSADTLAKIVSIFPDVNCEWLLLGKGEMLKKYENKQALSILAEESEVYGVVNYKEKYFETLEKLNQANERLLALTDIKKELIKKK